MSSTGTEQGQAPRITPEIIEGQIVHECYFTAAEGVIGAEVLNAVPVDMPTSLRLLTFCVLTLRNGYTVVGKSACASPANFSREIGQKVAREDAVRQIWPLLGYELRSKLSRLSEVSDDELGEALTRMTAYRLGNSEAFRETDAVIILNHFIKDEGEEGGITC